jgi:hypothetical protein
MKDSCIEVEVVVRPIHGMQLSEGYINEDGPLGFLGHLPGLAPFKGRTREEVRAALEQEAREYYGTDVVVEIVAARAVAC